MCESSDSRPLGSLTAVSGDCDHLDGEGEGRKQELMVLGVRCGRAPQLGSQVLSWALLQDEVL